MKAPQEHPNLPRTLTYPHMGLLRAAEVAPPDGVLEAANFNMFTKGHMALPLPKSISGEIGRIK